MEPKFDFRLWPTPGPLYQFYLIYFSFFSYYSLFLIFKNYCTAIGNRRDQLRYIFVALFIGFAGGSTNFAYFYNIHIPPIGNIFVFSYVLILAYAIVRYRLMDIKIVVTRASIFVVVYSFILGIPIWIGWKILGKGLWLLPFSLMGFFATLGPFIYLYLQKRAENRLLQEQRRYQATLRQASAGMGKIKDLKKLLSMIVYVLTHAIQIEHALIYIYNEAQKEYVLGASKRKSGHNQFIPSIKESSPLVQYFIENKNLIIFEEIKQKAQDYKDSQLVKIERIIISLEGALVVPIFIDQDLTAIIVMGKKESGKVYTEDDLGVFSILANQTALAIENAKFYEDMKFTHEQLFQAEKMATIGTMADGLSHQINNRFHALGFIAGDALDTIRLNQNEITPDKMKEVMTELERAFVRVQDNVTQGGEIVQGLLKYTRKGEAGFTAVDVKAVFKSALEMAQFKIKTDHLKIIHDYDPVTIPKIKGNFTQLQEVFFNLIDNGYDAMMQRKNEAKEIGYQPTLIVRVFKEDNYAQIIFEDNGMGVKEEDMHKLFTPFFTTKLSSKKGTGLGLYVIKKIVEDNHGGNVEMVSKYMQGTQMKLRLPIAIG
jgi:signal transduction histidine kinase